MRIGGKAADTRLPTTAGEHKALEPLPNAAGSLVVFTNDLADGLNRYS